MYTFSTQCTVKFTASVHYIYSVLYATLACMCTRFCTAFTHRVVHIALLVYLERMYIAQLVHHLRQQDNYVPKHYCNLEFWPTETHCWHKKSQGVGHCCAQNCGLHQCFGKNIVPLPPLTVQVAP